MKFSIVIPVYNAAATIKGTLQSCMEQSFTDFEIILADDASIDNSVEVINNFIAQNKKSNIQLVALEKNGGVAHTRNAAIAKAKGEYIVLLDSDDTFHSLKLALLHQSIERYPDTVMFVNLYDTEKHEVDKLNKSTISPLNFWSLLLQNKAQGSSICFKNNKDIRFDNTYRYCEDMELALRLSYSNECSMIEEYLTVLNRPQLSKGGLSGNKWQMRKAEMKIYSRLFRLNPFFVFLMPFLILFSLLKHLRKVKM